MDTKQIFFDKTEFELDSPRLTVYRDHDNVCISGGGWANLTPEESEEFSAAVIAATASARAFREQARAYAEAEAEAGPVSLA